MQIKVIMAKKIVQTFNTLLTPCAQKNWQNILSMILTTDPLKRWYYFSEINKMKVTRPELTDAN